MVTTAPAPRADHEGKDRQQRQERHERQQRMERQSKGFGQRGERPGGPPRRDRPRRERDEGPGRAEREQYYAKPFGGGGSERRDKAPDPNSPFAKLAALKQQLEQNSKDRP
jgi:ATP-dependent RNA helicase SUPV3L1/SUV3